MFSKIMMSNCNVGKDNRDNSLSQKEATELLTFATTLANALIIGIATKDMVANYAALLHSMVKNTLEKGPLSKAAETAYLVTEKDTHRCKPAEKLALSARNCGRNVETIL